MSEQIRRDSLHSRQLKKSQRELAKLTGSYSKIRNNDIEEETYDQQKDNEEEHDETQMILQDNPSDFVYINVSRTQRTQVYDHNVPEISRTASNFSISPNFIRKPDSEDPTDWNWKQVKYWLQTNKLSQFIAVFENNRIGTTGKELLEITVEDLIDETKPYRADLKLQIKKK
eukprot:42403_1